MEVNDPEEADEGRSEEAEESDVEGTEDKFIGDEPVSNKRPEALSDEEAADEEDYEEAVDKEEVKGHSEELASDEEDYEDDAEENAARNEVKGKHDEEASDEEDYEDDAEEETISPKKPIENSAGDDFSEEEGKSEGSSKKNYDEFEEDSMQSSEHDISRPGEAKDNYDESFADHDSQPSPNLKQIPSASNDPSQNSPAEQELTSDQQSSLDRAAIKSRQRALILSSSSSLMIEEDSSEEETFSSNPTAIPKGSGVSANQGYPHGKAVKADTSKASPLQAGAVRQDQSVLKDLDRLVASQRISHFDARLKIPVNDRVIPQYSCSTSHRPKSKLEAPKAIDRSSQHSPPKLSKVYRSSHPKAMRASLSPRGGRRINLQSNDRPRLATTQKLPKVGHDPQIERSDWSKSVLDSYATSGLKAFNWEGDPKVFTRDELEEISKNSLSEPTDHQRFLGVKLENTLKRLAFELMLSPAQVQSLYKGLEGVSGTLHVCTALLNSREATLKVLLKIKAREELFEKLMSSSKDLDSAGVARQYKKLVSLDKTIVRLISLWKDMELPYLAFVYVGKDYSLKLLEDMTQVNARFKQTDADQSMPRVQRRR
jgi:hypothetical protein